MGFMFKELDLEGAFLVSSFYSNDNRGTFTKIFEGNIFSKAGIAFEISETFISRSAKYVMRGLHFQTHAPQAKLVSVIAGRAWDVIVDLRPQSPTFKQWRAEELTAENHLSFYVPRGYAHGFVSLAEGTTMLYQCDGGYDSNSDTGIMFNDPSIGIDWPIDETLAIHSERDLSLMSLDEYMENPIQNYCV